MASVMNDLNRRITAARQAQGINADGSAPDGDIDTLKALQGPPQMPEARESGSETNHTQSEQQDNGDQSLNVSVNSEGSDVLERLAAIQRRSVEERADFHARQPKPVSSVASVAHGLEDVDAQEFSKALDERLRVSTKYGRSLDD